MDENSCEDETSKSVENVVDVQKPKKVDTPFELEDMKIITASNDEKINKHQISDRCGSSYDASVSGTSAGFSLLVAETPEPAPEVSAATPDPIVENPQKQEPNEEIQNNPSSPLLPVYEESQDSQPHVRIPTFVEQQLTTRKASIGPPPSYSFVMKQKKKPTTGDPLIFNRPPPPAYTGTRGLYAPPEETRLERMINLPSFGEPMWRSHSQPAFCTRCGVVVLTTTHSHDSIATHLAALALCLFGCWPCCLLPYCMNVCKNTYHHCPVCQAFLGVYSPW